MELWGIEQELREYGYKAICGVDEAGRGPLAGPVYAAAVILPLGLDIPKLNDSKKLSQKVREELYDVIIATAIDCSVASASHTEVDGLNILKATFLAMNRAVMSLKVKPDALLVDGNQDPGIGYDTWCIVKGDARSASIAAASILAKVSRDRYMADVSSQYPQYMFEVHKGYGTKMHFERLREHGPSEIHRVTFLRKYFDRH